jgi:dynein heavy chain 2
LKKLFAGIHSVQFDEGTAHIVAMKSVDGEVVPLKHKVQIQPEVGVQLSSFFVDMMMLS